MRFLWLVIPLSFALLRLVTRKYVFSALVSVSCAAIVLFFRPDSGAVTMALGLLVSTAGDWLLAHDQGRQARFICGVAAFGVGHALFCLYAASRLTPRFLAVGAVMTALLGAGYALYLRRRIFPALDEAMRAAIAAYAGISLLSLFFAMTAGGATGADKALYLIGIALILFSDTMIAESNFAKNRRARYYILPTYYMCHILLAASRLAR